MSLKTFLHHIFSFSGVFVLFLFSYQYKHAITFFKEHDPTLYLGLVMLMYLIYFIIRNYGHINFHKYIAVFSLFTLWLLGSYFWSSASTYAFAKIVRFLVYGAPAFLTAVIIIAPSSKRFDDFIVSLITFFGVISSITLLTYFKNPRILPILFDTNYLVTGQTIGLGAVILGAKLFHLKNPSIMQKSTLLVAGGILIAIFLELHIGGRGPLLSTLIVLGGMYAAFFKNKPLKFWMINLLGIVGIAVGFWLTKQINPNSLPASLTRIFSEDGIKTFTLRLEYYQSALQCFKIHLLKGVGIGSWPDYYGLEKLYELEWHPHNIFLEIAAETGLVGLSIFICLIILLVKKIREQVPSNELPITIIVCGTAFCFINALKSGDLNNNIVLFTFIGLLAGFKQKKERLTRPF